MPVVKFTYALKRFFPTLQDTPSEVQSLPELVKSMDRHYPGLSGYVLDEQGALRKHVNIFVDGVLISDREKLSDAVNENSEVFIMQALSGG